MNKKLNWLRAEKGQSIILVAVVMIGLLAMAGLAIDGGNLFLQRRRAQNAADSSAMAGTRVLATFIAKCDSGSSENDALVEQAMKEFVASNGFSEDDGATIEGWYVDSDTNRLGNVGAGSIPNTASGVEVRLEAVIDTYFLQVVGIHESKSEAVATAMSGRVVALTGGLLPIGLPLDVAQNLDPDEPFVVIDTNNDGSICKDDNGNGRLDGGEMCLGDPANQNSQRGWLNLNYIYNTQYVSQSSGFYRTFETNVANRGCGPDPAISTDDGLQGWAGTGCPYPHPIFAGTVGMTDGDFIHGSPGARQSSLSTVVDAYNGGTAYIPIFDYIYLSDYMADNFTQPEGIGWPRGGGGGSAYLYHIVGFAKVEINDGNSHDHELGASFKEAVVGDGIIGAGDGLGSGTCKQSMLYGVNLWE